MIRTLYRGLDGLLTFIEEWTLFVAVMAGLISLFVNVVLRYTIHYSLAWSEELIREIIIVTTFIGCSAAIRTRAMIRIDALPQMVPALKKPLNYFSHFCVLVYCVIITRLGWQMALLQLHTHQKTIILHIPLVVLYSVLPLMGVMMFIRTLQVMWEELPGRQKS
ncbi:MAG: TRAP transporter small permease [Deltaproteobacteria bacterium]|nr:TRAP transporter small permease [Candidatus Anaeroferrophillus wilburensis]MBN2888728.1 TRAP transporter small permease [Deltaproteobacteria bacterium]